MQGVIKYNAIINATSIHAMRYSGATLQQIADKIGRTKERVRQILIDNCGSTKHRLISTRQLCELTGLSKNRIKKFYQHNVITPVRQWDASNGHRSLWSPSAVEKVTFYSLTSTEANRPCRICCSPVPANRQCYCSEKCYKESHKYKYRSDEARQKHRIRMNKYRKEHRQPAQAVR